MPNLIKKFQNISHRHNLWQKNSKIVLGVSGGPDSVCLLDIFSKLQKKYTLKLIIAHVNYGLRGKDSDRDEKFVRNLAEKYNLPIFVSNPDDPKAELSTNLKLGFRKKPTENIMREIRYDFFEKIRRQNNFDLIAVAHNADDQVETYLMRLIRGAGLNGLSAMKFKNIHPVKSAKGGPAPREFDRGAIIRPMLGIWRQEILHYLDETDKTDKTYRIDRTNKTDLFFRNQIRNRLIPQLEKFNPGIKQTIFYATCSIAEDNDFLEKSAQKFYKVASAKKILSLHPALQRRLILKKIAVVQGNLKDISAANIEEIIKILKSTKNKSQIVVFKGLKLTRRGDRVIISSFKN